MSLGIPSKSNILLQNTNGHRNRQATLLESKFKYAMLPELFV